MADKETILRDKAQAIASLKHIFNSPEGEKALAYLKDYCFINKSIYSDSAFKMAFAEGQRWVVLHLQNILDKSIEELLNFPKHKHPFED